MPNISLDLFFDQDFINISASRGKNAPKAKPEWKVRTAPKLPPKETPVDPKGTPRPPPRPTINSTRAPAKPSKATDQKSINDKAANASDTASQTSEVRPQTPIASVIMATTWILGKVSDALAPTVQNACAGAGSFAGGAINTVGSSINGVGESIGTNIKYYGDGAKDYGNSIMDWSAAPASRGQTASNPLGLSSSAAGGKTKVTSPSVYRAPAAPKKDVVKAAPAQKRIAGVPKSGGSVAAPKPKVKVEPVKKPLPSKASNTPGKTPALPSMAGKVTPSAVKPKAVVKPSTASAAMAKSPAKKNPAGNPLGLKF